LTAAILTLNRRAFISLHKHRNYRLFFAGQVVSVTGTWMQRVAQAWLILSLTHSPVAVGFLVLANFLPFTIFGLFAGVIVDRIDARRAVVWTQTAQMVLSSVLAAIVLLGVAQPWHVYVIAALMGTVLVLDAPSRQALTFRMVGREELPNAVALNSSLFNGARIFGPGLGGVIIAVAGAGFCFGLNAVSYLAVLIGLLRMRTDDFHPVARRERPAIFRGMREGLVYVWQRPRALVVLCVVLVVSTFCFNFNVLLPVLAKQTLHSGPQTFGLLSAAFGAGALVGALMTAVSGRASMKALLVGTGGYALSELFLAPSHSLVGCVLLLFVTGVCFTVWTSNSNTALQLEAPDHLRGRVVGLYYYAFNGLVPLGGLFTGWLASRGGTELSFAVAGTIGLAMTVLAAASLHGYRPRFTRALHRQHQALTFETDNPSNETSKLAHRSDGGAGAERLRWVGRVRRSFACSRARVLLPGAQDDPRRDRAEGERRPAGCPDRRRQDPLSLHRDPDDHAQGA
jgi:MFS family permease